MMSYEEDDVDYGDDKHIHYLAGGPRDGELLVFVHGWPAIAKTWRPQLDFFAARGYRVVAPDMPGSGESTARQGDYTDYSIGERGAGSTCLTEAPRPRSSDLNRSRLGLSARLGTGFASP